MLRRACVIVSALALLAGCGGGRRSHQASAARASAPPPVASSPRSPGASTTPSAPGSRVSRRPRRPSVQALVTAETENRLLAVALPSGRVLARVAMPADPENVAATDGGVVLVVSARAGAVTALARSTLRPMRFFGGMVGPHIPTVSPDGRVAYVTDDAAGTVTVIRLRDLRVTGRVFVGVGAHHLAFAPDGRRAWVALGEFAHRIVILDTTAIEHPRVIGGFDPGVAVHDLVFSPDGRRVWVTSAAGRDVFVLDAGEHRVLFRVVVGAGPQHLVFAGRVAYLTSGYEGVLEAVDAVTGRELERTRTPYGSFELDARGGYVVVSSLLRGTLAVYDGRLQRVRTVRLAPAARDVVLSTP